VTLTSVHSATSRMVQPKPWTSTTATRWRSVSFSNEEWALQSLTSPGLTYSIEISGGIGHSSHVLPVLPGIGKGFRGCLPTAFCPVGSDERPAKARLRTLHEQAKIAVDVFSHPTPVRMRLLG
jgi:hypothetical protein